ncbi:hypothetical protein EV356DRAFT_534254 [Viridothelium virens]|uniref:Uncharacterized protein n=1 Tax=Viridothelium virens TaxID=1048519 RepID=A0A6A6H577_VIRVR|nr:hypothetical protein EV356DRAFT_534254 [Viridothelium virens]
MSEAQTAPSSTHVAPVQVPRIAIKYCTQCKWMLRAAYFGQELLSTFGTTIGEVALIPATGGIFTVKLLHNLRIATSQPATSVSSAIESSGSGINDHADQSSQEASIREVLIWDRKAEGGFPETKVLKQRIRDHLEPDRNLGHSDTKEKQKASQAKEQDNKQGEDEGEESGKIEECEDCK